MPNSLSLSLFSSSSSHILFPSQALFNFVCALVRIDITGTYLWPHSFGRLNDFQIGRKREGEQRDNRTSAGGIEAQHRFILMINRKIMHEFNDELPKQNDNNWHDVLVSINATKSSSTTRTPKNSCINLIRRYSRFIFRSILDEKLFREICIYAKWPIRHTGVPFMFIWYCYLLSLLL